MLILKEELELEDFHKVIFNNDKIELDDSLIKRVEASFNFLKEFSQDKVIYGVNTGFGPMAQYKIKDDDRIQLQYNLIRSHSSGTGNFLSPYICKGSYVSKIKYT